MKEKFFYIQTIGCQMNVYDSERMAYDLKSIGYTECFSVKTADLIIVNTCAIREKAEQKVFSFLGRLAKLKKRKPSLIVGVGGCVAQQEGARILKRSSVVDIVFGTHRTHLLPEMVTRVESRRQRIIDVKMSDTMIEDHREETSPSPSVSRFVTIMQGCDNFCTYCVVPYVRGREMSRKPEEIIREIESLTERGVKEVTLLGQNVNSYGIKDGLCSFPQLLEKINAISGLSRIRFTTSHPKDFSDELISTFGNLEKLCKHIHLPVQSGSNRILKKMNRRYTREIYLEKVRKLKDISPDIAVSSDFIVGFPGESQEEFEETLSLIEEVGFDSLFAFKYSDRPNAKALMFPDKIPDKVKKERLDILLGLQGEITRAKNMAQVGKTRKVLVDGPSKQEEKNLSECSAHETQWTGRTSDNKIVNFIRDDGFDSRITIIPGMTVSVLVEKAFSHSLWGKTARTAPKSPGLKGEESYAA